MLSLSQAAKQTGKSKSVISRALENGRLVAMKNDDGSYAINPEDLFSVFPEPPPEPAKQNAEPGTSTVTGTDTRTTAEPQQNTPEPPERSKVVALEAKSEALEAMSEQAKLQADDLRSTVADLQRRLDQAEADRRQLEADRRNADENATRQVDQLSQLLAMKEKAMQTLQLEHQAEQGSSKQGWWPWGSKVG